jgi:hypothetical protein
MRDTTKGDMRSTSGATKAPKTSLHRGRERLQHNKCDRCHENEEHDEEHPEHER